MQGRNTQDPIAGLIRARRESLGWSLAKLAEASGIRSPSYVFHLENGEKAPSIDVARRIAAALAEDQDLFQAWALVRGRSDLPSVMGAARRIADELARRGVGEAGPGMVAAMPSAVVADSASAAEPTAAASTPKVATSSTPAVSTASITAATARIPMLPEGADPDDPATAPIETLTLDQRLLPPLGRVERLFAYRLSAHGVRRAPEALRPGDCVVICMDEEPITDDALCAARIGDRVEIGRAAIHDGGVGLRDAAGGPDHHAPSLDARVIGRVILAFRRWL